LRKAALPNGYTDKSAAISETERPTRSISVRVAVCPEFSTTSCSETTVTVGGTGGGVAVGRTGVGVTVGAAGLVVAATTLAAGA